VIGDKSVTVVGWWQLKQYLPLFTSCLKLCRLTHITNFDYYFFILFFEVRVEIFGRIALWEVKGRRFAFSCIYLGTAASTNLVLVVNFILVPERSQVAFFWFVTSDERKCFVATTAVGRHRTVCFVWRKGKCQNTRKKETSTYSWLKASLGWASSFDPAGACWVLTWASELLGPFSINLPGWIR